LALRRAAGDEHFAPYPTERLIGVELSYRRLRPFTWAWVLFILGGTLTAVGMARSTAVRRHPLVRIGEIATVLGTLLVAVGLTARVLITSWGAVTNMYETLIFVALIVAVLGLILTRITGNAQYAVAAGIGAGLCAMVGEALPPDLGQNLSQLKAVLRSKFWLWIHVKTIVASYAAFVLAWVLGNLVLARAALERRAVTADESRAIYRALQVGIVLVAAGTLLGGFWAKVSWGRFWGWDPKEIGALIILLTYLIPLHLRHIGAVGPTGLTVWSVLGFFSVVMSWWGVNFLLGTGLHAYATGHGFGEASWDTVVIGVLSLIQLVVVAVEWQTLRSVRHAALAAPAGPSAAGPSGDRPS
ncbi:MAG: cytochrome c biogenesis protein CcsA, partial [Planctomycetes bacterium]|nr:cytochrome c biogenesis protein CcsA [Planctomycetota bacterium]